MYIVGSWCIIDLKILYWNIIHYIFIIYLKLLERKFNSGGMIQVTYMPCSSLLSGLGNVVT